MKTSQKIATFIVAFFILIPGLVKFTSKFKNFFMKQIDYSGLPFPDLTFIMGQASEIITGALLFSLLFFWKKFQSSVAEKLFFWANISVLAIMSVALYVHAHPAVPADVLPFEMKFPLLTLILVLLSGLNIYVQKKTYLNK